MRAVHTILFLFITGAALACTIGVARGDATTNGRPLLWKNRDVLSNQGLMYDAGYTYSFIGITTVGDTLPWMGVNDAGFAVLNALSSDLGRIGNGETMRLALRTCATRADFEALLDSTNITGRETHSNMGIIDANGEAVMYEVGTTQYWIYDTADTEDGYVVRSNFSIQGGGTGGAQKYARSLELMEQFIQDDNLNARTVLQHLCRDFCDSDGNGISVPFDGRWSAGFPWGYIPTSQSICNNSNGSACVIEGILPGEQPYTTTMWSILGHPAAGIAVPCWPWATVSDVLSNENGSPMCVASSALRTLLYDCSQSGGSNYIDTYKLDDGSGGGVWPLFFAVEDSVINEVETLRSDWQQLPPSREILYTLENVFANAALNFLNNITVDNTLHAAFSATPQSGQAPLHVQFEDMTPHQPVSLAWDMNGDGTVDTCGVSPTWVYTEAGDYTVTLWVASVADSSCTTHFLHVESVSTEEETDTLQDVTVWPNPAHGQASVAFSLPAEGTVELRVYDIRGRLVRTLQPGLLPQGEHVLNWDGRTDDGTPASSGVYLFQLRNGRFTRTGKVILLK